MSTPPDQISEKSQDLSSFTVNANRRTGGFRGKIKVESPFLPGDYVERTYTTGPIRLGQTGKEFAFVTVGSNSPNNASRESGLDPDATPNPHPGIRFREVNRGVYFPATDQEMLDAKADGRRIPAGKAYVLMPFINPDNTQKIPYVVELSAWEQQPKDNASAGADAPGEIVSWYGGSAKIFDRETYLANSKKYAAAPHDEDLTDADWSAAGAENSAPAQAANAVPDAPKARKGASKRAQQRHLPEDPNPSQGD